MRGAGSRRQDDWNRCSLCMRCSRATGAFTCVTQTPGTKHCVFMAAPSQHPPAQPAACAAAGSPRPPAASQPLQLLRLQPCMLLRWPAVRPARMLHHHRTPVCDKDNITPVAIRQAQRACWLGFDRFYAAVAICNCFALLGAFNHRAVAALDCVMLTAVKRPRLDRRRDCTTPSAAQHSM